MIPHAPGGWRDPARPLGVYPRRPAAKLKLKNLPAGAHAHSTAAGTRTRARVLLQTHGDA